MSKWGIDFRIYTCSCGLAFWSRKHWLEHKKDTKRWKQYHKTPDKFMVLLSHKKGMNINEAFKER